MMRQPLSNPPPIDQPMLGVGVNSSVTGYLRLENPEYHDVSLIDNLQVILNYTTSVDGPVRLNLKCRYFWIL